MTDIKDEEVTGEKKSLNFIEQIVENDLKEELKESEKDKYIKEIKKRKMCDNIKVRNLKQLLKKILLKINLKLYYPRYVMAIYNNYIRACASIHLIIIFTP